jgi:drug/metabolite transporter (DMT)-like permease
LVDKIVVFCRNADNRQVIWADDKTKVAGKFELMAISNVMPGKIGLGIVTVSFAILLFGVMDAGAKWLIASYPVIQIIFMRNLVALPPLAFCAMVWGGKKGLHIKSWKMALGRGVLISIVQGFFFYSLLWLPFATAISLYFAGPLFITLLSIPVLRERVGPLRWLAVIVGFIGVVVICSPGTEFFTPYALLPVIAAFGYAVVIMMIRLSPHEDSTAAVTFFGNLAAAVICFLFLPFGWEAIASVDIGFFLLIGVSGAFAALALNAGYRYASASLLAPLDYLALPLALVAGYYIWGEVLPSHFWVGSILVVGSGMFIAIRESAVASRANRET